MAKRGTSRAPMDEVLAVVMAGGRGTRLGALTRGCAKPAVPFGGEYRIIDYTMSNCFNSGVQRMAVLTQYEARDLIAHLQRAWAFRALYPGEFVSIWPAQQDSSDDWYQGTADAVRQNLQAIMDSGAEHVLILAGDHVYSMDYRELVQRHVNAGADVTVACTEVPLAEARRCGVVEADEAGRVHGFTEKPDRPVPIRGRPDEAYVSMGIYAFRLPALAAALGQDGGSLHDFGGDVLPAMLEHYRVLAFPFVDDRGRPRFWRDAGTVDAYYEASMALLDPAARRDLYRPGWQVVTADVACSPAILERDEHGRRATVVDSIVARGASICGGRVSGSIVSRGVEIGPGAEVTDSVLLPGARIGEDCRIANAVVGPGCSVPAGTVIDGKENPGEGTPHVVLVTRETLAGVSSPDCDCNGNRDKDSDRDRDSSRPRQALRLVESL